MAFAFRHETRSPLPSLALTLSWRGTQRCWTVRHASGLAATAVVALVALWYLGATAYFVFHDDLVSSLISHQADAQYSYEDRIAVLQTQLDRETSRGMIDRQVLAKTIDTLASKSKILESRSLALDTLVKSIGGEKSEGLATSQTLLPAAQIQGQSEQGAGVPTSLAHEDHAELSPAQIGSELSARLEAVATRQAAAVAMLRAPTLRKVERIRTALLDAGIPYDRWKSRDDVGGPFVPLPEGASTTFEQNIAVLQSAVAEHRRLASLVDVVPLHRPVDGRLEVTSPFGARVDPFLGQAAMHTGLDLVESPGAAVRATANGTVTVAGNEGGYGNMVEVDHGNGLVTRYAHLSSIEVAPHEKVLIGTIVGRVGSTGRATGPHLHYETRVNGVPVDPARFLKAGLQLFSTKG